MENTTIINAIAEKKLDRYDDRCLNNFLAAEELSVTITLNEYRDLVKKVSISESEIEKAKQSRWEAERKCKELTEEVSNLKAKLYELTKIEKGGDE